LLGGTLLVAPAASVLAADLAPVVTESGWYSYGTWTAGVNFFVQKPPSGFGRTSTSPFWLTPNTSDSNAKMDEYGRIPRGLFLKEFAFSAGRKDGRFDVDVWADNVGTDHQSYYLGLYEAGRHYFSLGYDQTPHLLSTSAKSIFGGVGSTRVTVDPASRTFLQSQMADSQSQAQRDNIADFINGRNTFGGAGFPAPIANIELKTLREKFTVGYRNTMLDDWDFRFDYSHEKRSGLQPIAMGYGFSTAFANPFPASGSVEVPVPVDDRTQNADASGEYQGSTPWGGRFITSVKYSGSSYTNNNKFIDVDNPFCITCTALAAPFGPSMFRYSLDPDNSVNGLTWNTMVELPARTRYTGTLQYMMFRQNDPFINTATNGLTFGLGAGQINPYPASSLNGQVNAFLTNNVFYTRITPELTNTARIRYYDRNDQTPALTFTNYAYADGGVAPFALTRQSSSYTRLSIADDLKWQPNRVWGFGVGYFYDRYTYAFNEVDATNEHGAKAFVTLTPFSWFTTRSSVQYAQRRYDNWVAVTTDLATRAMRQFSVQNRNQTKAQTTIDVQLTKDITVTPNGGVRWTEYPIDAVLDAANLATGSLGVQYDRQWNAGIDIGIRLSPELRATLGYSFEEHRLYMQDGSPFIPFNDQNKWSSEITQQYNIFMASVLWNAMPGRLDIKADYIAAISNEANNTTGCASNMSLCTGKNAAGDPAVVWPDVHNIFQRATAMLIYYVDPSVVKQMGWVGDVTLKARYTWEQNRNSNWATDSFAPYSPSAIDFGSAGKSLFLAYNNPNYTAQIVAVSASVRW
jgi:MtrB/PioB family decaheme-associated outer membrane protein